MAKPHRWSVTAFSLIVVALAGLVSGCSDEGSHPFVPPDGPPVSPDSGVPFLGVCSSDSECASGRCAEIAGVNRCTRPCSATTPCPAYDTWSCGGSGYCTCTPTGKQPTVCHVDGDCDGQPDRPILAETCNGEDDDCDGAVDNVAPNTSGAKVYYRDQDDDDYGDLLQSKWLCTAEEGWVEDKYDCDDSRPEDHPGAVEICGDAYDNDCDSLKEDADVCGSLPISVDDVTGEDDSALLKTCSTPTGTSPGLDITEIVAKQDTTRVKFTVRLAGAPAVGGTCSSYTLQLGDPQQADHELVYIYRPATTACGSLATLEAYKRENGQLLPMVTDLDGGFQVQAPGHVSFTMTKTEFLEPLPSPTYRLKACTNATADGDNDKTACVSDSCETPVHR